VTTRARAAIGTIRGELRAVRIAPAAIEALRAGSGWKVLSSHSHAINFVDTSGNLLSITEDRVRMGPFSVEVETTPGGFPVAETVDALASAGAARICLGNRTLDLTSAEIWNARPDWAALARIPWQSDFLPVILARLRASAPRESLACVVEHLHRRPKGPREVSLRELPQAAAATSAIRVIRALATGDLQEVASAGAALAGTGIGLTPSGDDFLIGVIFGIQSALPDAKAKGLSRRIYRASMGRMNRISEAWLAAAAEGQASQPWHDLVDSVLSDDCPMVDRACQNLIELGHTSGADALAGFAAFHLARPSSMWDPP
jgi:hypothetical protein